MQSRQLEKHSLMPTLKLHYDGWLLLPAALRRQLGLNSGDRLDVELIDGTIVLRSATTAKRSGDHLDLKEVAASPAPDAAGNVSQPDAAPIRRGPGRPRKHQAGADLVSPAPKRLRGRPKRIPAPVAELPPVPTVSDEPWKLRRKADVLQQAAHAEPAPQPTPLPYRTRSKAGPPVEERRPFRNVEVRKLGPGRRHNRS
jgi:AbrB family looped-hinge helix DNA binding protein